MYGPLENQLVGPVAEWQYGVRDYAVQFSQINSCLLILARLQNKGIIGIHLVRSRALKGGAPPLDHPPMEFSIKESHVVRGALQREGGGYVRESVQLAGDINGWMRCDAFQWLYHEVLNCKGKYLWPEEGNTRDGCYNGFASEPNKVVFRYAGT